MLLALEGIHLDGHFSRRDHVGEEHEPPAAQLRPVAEIQIFGQRVVLPSAGVVDGAPPPDARRAVEIEEAAAAIAAAMLEHEVAVQQDGLDFREQRVILIDVTPSRLHHADARVREVRHDARQEIGRGHEIGVEDRDELAARGLQAGVERARLEPDAVGAVVVLDVHALGGIPPDRELGNALRLVGRIVQDLNLQQLTRILDGADRLDEPVGDVHLVVERKLNRDSRKWIQRRLGPRFVVPVRHVQIHEVVPMPTVYCENDQNKEVRS